MTVATELPYVSLTEAVESLTDFLNSATWAWSSGAIRSVCPEISFERFSESLGRNVGSAVKKMAGGRASRRRMLRFRAKMEPESVATTTQSAPGLRASSSGIRLLTLSVQRGEERREGGEGRRGLCQHA